MRSTTRICTMAVAAAGLVIAPVAYAQDKSPPTAPSTTPKATTTPADIPDSKLDATAAAVKRVSALKDTFDKKLAQAPAAEKQRVVGEANEAMTKAVTDQGLTVEEYTTIITVAQRDPAVRDKLLQRLK